MTVEVARTVGGLHRWRAAFLAGKKGGGGSVAKIALVPTMGALHEGHLSLVRRARQLADGVIVSVYVNPLQFGAGEDYADYPRGLAADCRLLDGLADVVFAPGDKLMYPRRQEVGISLPPLAGELCGRSRPGFFEGVAVAVCKLLNMTCPDVALFGKKDYQQWILMKEMALQLNIGVQIAAGPIVREWDGLALSSRNAYLTPAERKTAPLLRKTLLAAAAAIGGQKGKGGANNRAREEASRAAKKCCAGAKACCAGAKACCAGAKAKLRAAGFLVDYFELRDARTLLSPRAGKKAILLAAATLGKTRLIDNAELTLPG